MVKNISALIYAGGEKPSPETLSRYPIIILCFARIVIEHWDPIFVVQHEVPSCRISWCAFVVHPRISTSDLYRMGSIDESHQRQRTYIHIAFLAFCYEGTLVRQVINVTKESAFSYKIGEQFGKESTNRYHIGPSGNKFWMWQAI